MNILESNLLKEVIKFLNLRLYTNVYTLIIIIGAYLFWKYSIEKTKEVLTPSSKIVLSYIDSIDKKNKILFSKIDSLDLNKKEKLTVYQKTILKYDTIKIMVDSMAPIDATLFLLSKSRQLTNKGIE